MSAVSAMAANNASKPRLIVIGASLGGLKALRTVLAALPADFPAALAVAQHRDASGGDALALLLAEVSALPVREAEDKSPVEAGIVTLAPTDYHLLAEGDHFALAAREETDLLCPLIDALFESAADEYGPAVVGVVLSGTGSDGARGLAAIARAGGPILIQAPASAEASAMPAAALAASARAEVLPLARIGERLVQLAAGRLK